jgi:hypothetical protein
VIVQQEAMVRAVRGRWVQRSLKTTCLWCDGGEDQGEEEEGRGRGMVNTHAWYTHMVHPTTHGWTPFH